MRKLVLIPVISGALLAIVFLLAGTPFVLAIVKEKIETAVNQSTGVPLMIGRLRGNLFYATQLEDIDFANTIQVEKLRVKYNPFRLLAKQVEITSIQISGVHVDFDRLEAFLKTLPEKTEETKAETKAETRAFGITIREFSIMDSDLFGTVGNTSLRVLLATRGSLMHDQFELDSLCIVTENSQVMISGSIPLNEQDDISLEFDMAVTVEELGIPGFAGEINGRGSVSGKFSAIALQGIMQLDVRYLENSLSGDVALEWLIPNFRDLNVEARLLAKTLPLRKDSDRPDRWDLSLKINDANLDCDVSSNLGDLSLRGVLKSDFTEPYFKGTVEGRFDYADFEPSFSGRLYYRNDTLELSEFELLSRRVDVGMALLLRTDTKRILKAEADLVCNDLSVVDNFFNSGQAITGKLRCRLSASGTLDNSLASATVGMSDVVIYGEKIPVALFDLSVQNSTVRLDSGFIESERGKITLAGSCDLQSLDFTASLYSDGIVFKPPEVFGTTTLPLGGTVGLDLAAQGNVHAPRVQGEIFVNDFVYDTLYFGNYHLECRLDADTLQFSFMTEKEDLVLDATMILGGVFPYTANLELRHYVVDRYITPATGYVTARISAEGALVQIIDASGSVAIDTVKLFVEGQPIENVGTINVQLKDRIFHLRSCEVIIAGQYLHANGSIPLEFAAGSIDITASSGQIQLADIAYLLPHDPAIRGLLRFDLRVQGVQKALDVDGMLSLTDASYKAGNISVDSVNGLLRFKNGLATVDRLTGKVNKGRFEVVGFADVSRGLIDTMLLQIKLNRIDYTNKDFGYIVCSADLHAGARKDSLRISGEVIIDEAAYTAPMRLQTYVRLLTNANRPAPQQPEMAKRIYCDISIVVPDSVVIDNNVADLAVKADLQLKGYLARLNVYGTIAALDEGKIHYLGKKFTIVNAVIQFDDPYKIDPVIELMATSTITAADGDYEIFLLLEGTATTWQLELNSDPPLPEQDIVSLILIGQRRPGGAGGMAKELDLKGKVRDYALDMVRHNIEKKTEEILGLDKFTLSGDLSDPSTMRIGIEKSIAEDFRLHYSTGVESWELYQVGASYDLTDKLSIFTLYDQENRNTSVDLEYHLKIK
ncbi:hypothetical protein AMJ83_04330 [candidate division WOR_3 bacterium SM23_42]|uniref:Translocation and assembly module TamB C-terminal domain-containing protein n=1 Tax=candidate division WOR_3 bacterium SM23_42 TaxID=1703779 RepID=A0A0S8FTE4_UNCW3|nr:MAG: hypothetical protein AMJ83_04330 [candidate division WOR_3 bacterium SM23_42]